MCNDVQKLVGDSVSSTAFAVFEAREDPLNFIKSEGFWYTVFGMAPHHTEG